MCFLPSACREQFKEVILRTPGMALCWAETSVPVRAFSRQWECMGRDGVLKYFWGQIFNCLVNWVIKRNCCAEKRTVVSAVGLLKRKRVRSVLPASQIIAVGPADKGARSLQKVALQVERE